MCEGADARVAQDKNEPRDADADEAAGRVTNASRSQLARQTNVHCGSESPGGGSGSPLSGWTSGQEESLAVQ